MNQSLERQTEKNRYVRNTQLEPNRAQGMIQQSKRFWIFVSAGVLLIAAILQGCPPPVYPPTENTDLDAVYLRIDNIAEGLEARSANPLAALMAKVASVEEAEAYLDAVAPVDLFEIEYEDAVPELVDLIHGEGIKVHINALVVLDWIADGYQELIDRGADVIQTDRLKQLVPFVRGLPEEG